MVAAEGESPDGSTPDEVENAEVLHRWYDTADFQDGKIVSAVFRSTSVSVDRGAYKSAQETLREQGASGRIAAILAYRVRSIDGLDVRKDEPPRAHAVIERKDGPVRLTTGQARRLRDGVSNVDVTRPPPDALT